MAHPLESKIKELVESSPVVIFMKGTPDFPQCGFSNRACQVLKAAGAKNLVGVDVLSDDSLWEALEVVTEWPTVPQIFINGEFVGGCDIVSELFDRGELETMVKAASTT